MKKYIMIIGLLFIISGCFVIYFLKVKDSKFKNTIKVSGNIEATETRLSFQIEGKINQLYVDEGYFLKKGQLAAILDKEEQKKITEQAKANLEQAKSVLNLRQKEYERYNELLKTNAVSVEERDLAQNNFEVANANLVTSQKALELADVRFNYLSLISPIDCFVIAKSAEVGEVVQPGTPVFTVVDMNDIWLTAYINETDLGRIHLNQIVDIQTDSYPAKIYKGRISFISEESEFTPKYIQTTEERVKFVYRIKIDVNNTNFELKPGMPADGYIRE
jgi:HlyD family secretion protein